jgi:hypothetical protein
MPICHPGSYGYAHFSPTIPFQLPCANVSNLLLVRAGRKKRANLTAKEKS